MKNPNTVSSFRTAPHLSELKAIEALIQQEQMQSAAQSLNHLQKLHPLDPRIYLLGSLLAERSGNTTAMLASAARASELAPGWHVTTLRLAQAQLRASQGEAAVAQATKAVEQVKGASPEERRTILQACVDIALSSRAYSPAEQWLEQLIALDPTALTPRLQQGHLLVDTDQREKALESFDHVLKQAPEYNAARVQRMLCAHRLGHLAQAEADALHLEQHAPDDPVAQFYAAVVLGREPSTQPPELIGQLFDSYAPRFDQHLVRGLRYTLPRDVAQRIEAWHPDRRLNVLDLGCGTGLLGVCLGRLEGALIGVDLSAGMIEQATRHGVYDRFHQVNVLDALAATPDGLYQVITALDVLIYIGDLETVVPNALRILAPGGRFVFSCESLDGEHNPYTLDPRTRRYRHSRHYVEKLCEKAGFALTECQEMDLRQEGNQPVPGFLFIATKAADTAPVSSPGTP